MLDYHVIMDLLPTVASLYFEKRLGEEVRLSAVQSSILLALGLQRKTIEEIEVSLSIVYLIRSHIYLNYLVGRTAAACRTGTRIVRQSHQENQQAAIGRSESRNQRGDSRTTTRSSPLKCRRYQHHLGASRREHR